MATCSDWTPADTLDCPICNKQFNTPRTLPCLHTICERCLDSHILSQQEGRCGCPFCDTQIVPPNIKLTRDKWAGAFPLNDLILSVIKIQNKTDDEYCQPCKVDDNIPAEFWCVNCQERLCGPCNTYHHRQTSSTHHETVPINEMEHYIESKITFDQNCIQHPGYKLGTFCVNHRALCCSVCISTNHRDCGDIRNINSAAENQAKRCTFRDIIKQISQIKSEIDKILADKMENRSQIKTEKEQIIHTMDVRIDQIIDNLNALRASYKNETENLYEETENSIVKFEKKIKCFQTNLINSQEILELIKNENTPRKRFIAFETVHSQVASHYEQLKSTTQDDGEIHFSLKANAALRDIEELSSLGAVQTSSIQPESFKNTLKTVDDVIKKLSSMSKLSTELCAAQIAKPMTSRVTFVKAITRKKYGGGTDFTGGTVLPDGRLLMADFYNKRLVQLEKDYNMVQQYKVDGRPRDVAAGQTGKEIYIAVYKGFLEYYVYKCKLRNVLGLKVVSRIKAPYDTWGIAVSGDNIIVGARGAVVILNQDGTTVKSIPKSGGDCYVAVSQTQRTMCHGDNQDVVCRTLEGSELFRYRHQQLEGPRGICTDTHGRTYICGFHSHNVHQVSPDGKTSTILELHTISRPQFCVFLPQRNELLVTSDREDTALEVYKLE